MALSQVSQVISRTCTENALMIIVHTVYENALYLVGGAPTL